jgi:hypothetical protein
VSESIAGLARTFVNPSHRLGLESCVAHVRGQREEEGDAVIV